VTLLDLIFKMMPFKGQVFGVRFGSITVSQNNARSIVLKDLAHLKVIGFSKGENWIKGGCNETMVMELLDKPA
jgi:hypothetical protein